MRKLLAIFLTIASFSAFAQELNCAVSINATQIQTSDASVFKDMENGIEQFMNSRKWTNDPYKNHEKIICNFLITITKMPSIGTFSASVQVQSARPVYNSSYNS